MSQCQKFLETDKKYEHLSYRISAYLGQENEMENGTNFEDIYDDILLEFNKSEHGKYREHDLYNLTLLDVKTNRRYRNAVFAVKRHILLENDRSGIYIPLCTRNVFTKSYSNIVGNVLFWTQADAEDYFNQICKTLSDFFQLDKVF